MIKSKTSTRGSSGMHGILKGIVFQHLNLKRNVINICCLVYAGQAGSLPLPHQATKEIAPWISCQPHCPLAPRVSLVTLISAHELLLFFFFYSVCPGQWYTHSQCGLGSCLPCKQSPPASSPSNHTSEDATEWRNHGVGGAEPFASDPQDQEIPNFYAQIQPQGMLKTLVHWTFLYRNPVFALVFKQWRWCEFSNVSLPPRLSPPPTHIFVSFLLIYDKFCLGDKAVWIFTLSSTEWHCPIPLKLNSHCPQVSIWSHLPLVLTMYSSSTEQKHLKSHKYKNWITKQEQLHLTYGKQYQLSSDKHLSFLLW